MTKVEADCQVIAINCNIIVSLAQRNRGRLRRNKQLRQKLAELELKMHALTHADVKTYYHYSQFKQKRPNSDCKGCPLRSCPFC